jgi:hypothetical protein
MICNYPATRHTNDVTSSQLHVDFGFCCLRRKLTLKRTFGISSSSTSREDHEARHKSRHAMNMTPNDPRTEASTCKSSRTQPENSEACIAKIQALTMKETTSKAHMQEHKFKESCKKQPGRNTGPNRPRNGLGRSAQSDRPRGLLARFATPFSLGVCLFIASTVVGRHIEQIIPPTPFTRKPPSQDEEES